MNERKTTASQRGDPWTPEEQQARDRELGQFNWHMDVAYTQKEARAEGWAIGGAQGRQHGRIEGLAEGLLLVLAMRGLALAEADRKRIAQCEDPDCLARWLARAATEDTLSDVLTESP